MNREGLMAQPTLACLEEIGSKAMLFKSEFLPETFFMDR
ncbi:hypothetical protein B4135_0382 [Caldibacillus debilis]|uniref:Uncharacterized protein n=1 Tax=Caldibacillus debilis TaxID=301148 RepID=A0A150LK79_9BACI|nr:hypothetical protein B4135_0382 [Caldibacillus debilis]